MKFTETVLVIVYAIVFSFGYPVHTNPIINGMNFNYYENKIILLKQ